jgi:3-deoxy-D-manno-octulosonic-acid transferase
LNEFPDLKLLIAPRHPERAEGVAKLASKNGFLPVLVSGLGLIGENGRRTTDDGRRTAIFVLDTIGELIHYYAVSDIVFVGGSLVKKGGHNIIEPASFAKPVVFGPQTFNFRDITELFLRRKAAIMVRNTQELKAALRLLLSDSNRARELADAAGKLILENQGATLKNIERIKDFLT